MYKYITSCLIMAVLAISCGSSGTPNHDRAIEVGRDYSTNVFDLTLTGTRALGMNDDYRIVGHILPVRKRVNLGERFELSRGDIISVSGVLTEIDKDHLRFVGHFKGNGPAQHPLDVDIDVSVSLGIHGGQLYFRDPNNLYASAGGNDYLEIDKIEKKDLPNISLNADD